MNRVLQLTREDRFWIGVLVTTLGLVILITGDPLVPTVAGFVLLLCSLPRKKTTTFIDLSEDKPVEKVNP